MHANSDLLHMRGPRGQPDVAGSRTYVSVAESRVSKGCGGEDCAWRRFTSQCAGACGLAAGHMAHTGDMG